MVVINIRIYMFGGFAREPFNDTRVIIEYDDKYNG
jgi:hypothetical protein